MQMGPYSGESGNSAHDASPALQSVKYEARQAQSSNTDFNLPSAGEGKISADSSDQKSVDALSTAERQPIFSPILLLQNDKEHSFKFLIQNFRPPHS